MIISVPYFIKSKAWDVVIMMTFLMTIRDRETGDCSDMINLC